MFHEIWRKSRSSYSCAFCTSNKIDHFQLLWIILTSQDNKGTIVLDDKEDCDNSHTRVFHVCNMKMISAEEGGHDTKFTESDKLV